MRHSVLKIYTGWNILGANFHLRLASKVHEYRLYQMSVYKCKGAFICIFLILLFTNLLKLEEGEYPELTKFKRLGDENHFNPKS